MHQSGPLQVSTVDYHTAGEPFRIVSGGVPTLRGATVAERRHWAEEHMDHIRSLLVKEPRGHADMYGGFVTPPDDDDADLGVVFFHNEGFSTACGHGTIALVTWALESGLLPITGPDTRVVIDVPSGRVHAIAHVSDDGRVHRVRFTNVPSYVHARDVKVETESGVYAVDVAFGGAFYAIVDAATAGGWVAPQHLRRFIQVGREIKDALNADQDFVHPLDPDLHSIYGVVFVDDIGGDGSHLQQRNVTVFADGEVDRSPTGSATSARLALLHDAGRLRNGRVLENCSIIDTVFFGRVTDTTAVGDYAGVVTEISGTAHLTGYHTFVLEHDDPIETGFLLR